jgi:hypothetical protein
MIGITQTTAKGFCHVIQDKNDTENYQVSSDWWRIFFSDHFRAQKIRNQKKFT